MERLISSSSPSSFSSPSIPKHRHLLPYSKKPCLPLLPLKSQTHTYFSKQVGPPQRLRSRVHTFLSDQKKKEKNCACNQVDEPANLNADFIEKAATSTIFILLSSLLITTIHPILAQPAYAATITSGNLIKSELLSSAWAGFFTGCLHTLSGPDHLAALAPLSIGRSRIESAIVGALWGCGHDAGQVIFGLLFLLLKDQLHIEIIRTWGTRVVGLTLLVIGGMGLKEASETPTPGEALENGEHAINSIDESLKSAQSGRRKIGFATFATGIVHGLQPDALMMVLPALALPSRVAGAAFLGMFLVGTVLAMGSYTVFIGSCSQALKERIPRITEKLTWAASILAISMGVGIIISQFFGFSLY